jgi:translation initiation factor IF-3
MFRQFIRHTARTFSTKPNQTLINEKINHELVNLISLEGKRLGETTLKEALSSFDRTKFNLVQVSSTPTLPICRIIEIVSKNAPVKDKESPAKVVQKEAKKLVVKEMEINTSIDPHDLETKLKKGLHH